MPPQIGSPQQSELSAPHGGLIDGLGRTPLVRLRRLVEGIELWVKLEGLNPGGSSKSRPAARMLADALADGRLSPGGTVVESSSGNMGVGLAQTCALWDLNLICIIDERTNRLARQTMKALGAELRIVDAERAGDRSLLEARLDLVREIVDETPNAFWPNQYENPSNPRSHEAGTMREIDDVLGGEIDYIFVAAGTGGTLRGCLDYLAGRPQGPRVVAVDAIGSVLFGGEPGPRRLPGMGASIESDHARACKPHLVERVDELACVVACRRAARREGLLLGASSGGVLAACSRLARQLPAGSRFVAICPDLGAGYLETVFDDDWVQRELGASPTEVAAEIERTD